MTLNYPLLSQQLPEQIKKVWYQVDLFTALCFSVLGGIGTIALHLFDFFNHYWLWGIIIFFSLVIFSTIVSLLLIPYRYRFQRYEITDDEIIFQSGYFFRSTTYVPINRIQHIETTQGPFLRRHKLMGLKIHTAATSHEVSGLSLQVATDFQQRVTQLVKVASADV